MLPPELGWVVGCSFTGQPTEPAEVRNVMAAAMSFRRDLVRELGGFAEWIGRIGTTPFGLRGDGAVHPPAAAVPGSEGVAAPGRHGFGIG